ncbi:MAG: Glycosyltransferase [Candidatus Roizmanbacteria bacterium GW2011_GWA2_35_19]|uniref:Glycosyltransferase n=2 Tax=Candidatus Roizmaniibacteriota TaxID=1752723 RepID=A0A0G0EEY9_9BACT|nr:MAG: Glycosyltransferase [Candidatus Roizmanbacteria bacterium GW2011_GWC2_35_12]KKP73765.1 MAG: Glycosyltransferase [Candidatus Roizmanbacteria bacterium GW2011_GWA2_35_19]
MRKLVVILPTYNEKGNVGLLITEIFDKLDTLKNWELSILVVDSKSPDGTGTEIKKLRKKYPRLYLLEVAKEGLGRAYTQAFSYLEKNINPYLVIQMDADLSHNPDSLPDLIKKIENGADFVIGSRYIRGGSIPPNWGLHRKFLSVMGNLTVKLGFMKLRISDWTSGYRAIKFWLVKKAFQHIKNYSGYVFQIAFLDFALKNNAVIGEVPIHFRERKSGVSKINFVQYIFSIFLYIFLHSSFIKFAIVGVLGFGVDFGISYLMIEILHKAVWISTLLSTETAIISNFIMNNFWSFSDKKIEGGITKFITSFLKYNLVSSGSIAIQTFGVSLLASLLGKQFWFLYKVTIITLVVIPYSYFFYNKFIWKSK